MHVRARVCSYAVLGAEGLLCALSALSRAARPAPPDVTLGALTVVGNLAATGVGAVRGCCALL
jgi:hypothetical protein